MKWIDLIIKKLEKITWKIIDHSKIIEIISKTIPEYDGKKPQLHKMIFLLRWKGYIYNIKKQLYLITKPNRVVDENEILQKYYRELLKSNCKKSCDDKRYISWIKALELYLNNHEIPAEIYIINPNKTSLEVNMFDYKIAFKKYTNKSLEPQEHFKQLNKFTKKINISNKKYPIASIELAILESLYSPSPDKEKYITEIVQKIIKKYKKNVDLSTISRIMQINKYHTSINRLYTIIKSMDSKLGQDIYNIIKKYSYVL